jgi:isocitrate/isopropylmalate dehydrogenase
VGAAERTFDLVVRENTEGEYGEIGGRLYQGRPHELAVREAVFTRHGVERIARYAFGLARTRSRRVASATKSNTVPEAACVDVDVRACQGRGQGLEVERVERALGVLGSRLPGASVELRGGVNRPPMERAMSL